MNLSLGSLKSYIADNPKPKHLQVASTKPVNIVAKEVFTAPFAASKGLGAIYGQQQINEGSDLNIPQRELSNSGYLTKLAKHESQGSGDYKATNKSGATGRYQFFESTAEPYLKKINATWEQFKTDPGIQDYVAEQHTNHNKGILVNNNIPVTDANLWYLHNQGGAGGLKVIRGEGKASIKNMRNNLPEGIEPTEANYKAYWSKQFA